MTNEPITYHIDQFDGPLDLLLTLIDKNKISIEDIPIASILDQYMAYIEEAQKMELEIACEFILMASTLMLIKSKMLLPRISDNEEDPRKELVDALLIYQKAKQDAEELRPRYAEFSGRMPKDNEEIPAEKGFPLGLDPSLLTKALNTMLSRLKVSEDVPTTLINPLIKKKIVPVEERIDMIVEKLTVNAEASFFFLLKDATDRPELLASFLGILELIKIRRILFCEDDEGEFSILTKFKLNPDYDPEAEEETRALRENLSKDDDNNDG